MWNTQSSNTHTEFVHRTIKTNKRDELTPCEWTLLFAYSDCRIRTHLSCSHQYLKGTARSGKANLKQNAALSRALGIKVNCVWGQKFFSSKISAWSLLIM